MTVTPLDTRRTGPVQGPEAADFPRGLTRRFDQEQAERIVASGALETLGRYLGYSSLVIDQTIRTPGALAVRLYGQSADGMDAAEAIVYLKADNHVGISEEQLYALGIPAAGTAVNGGSFAAPYAKLVTIMENYGYRVATAETAVIAAA